MGERKVLNKYYPHDFDPRKIPRRRQPKNQQIKVRMMLPMSIRCQTCGTYIYEGTKFNSRKEVVIGETYLEIPISRFYFKCTKCSAELTMKTDPQNADYVVESGAARNFEPLRKEDESTENEKRKREAEEMGDAMKSLENRASDSKQDMDILATLEEMKSMKSRHATVSVDDMLATLQRSRYEKEKRIMEEIDKADEEVIKSIIFPGSKEYVRRIHDDEDEDDILDADLFQPSSSLSQSSNGNFEVCMGKGATVAPSAVEAPTDALTKASIFNSSKNGAGGSSILKPKFILKPRSETGGPPNKKPAIECKAEDQPKNEEESKSDLGGRSQTVNGLQSLCQNYDSDESDG